MSHFWSRLGQSLIRAGAMNARQPLLAWEAAWDEGEALMASGKLWAEPQPAPPGSEEAVSTAFRNPLR